MPPKKKPRWTTAQKNAAAKKRAASQRPPKKPHRGQRPAEDAPRSKDRWRERDDRPDRSGPRRPQSRDQQARDQQSRGPQPRGPQARGQQARRPVERIERPEDPEALRQEADTWTSSKRSSVSGPVEVAADNGFAGLGLPAVLVERLAREGITTPFPIQEATIPDALAAVARPDRARPSPSACRCWPASPVAGPAAAGPARSCSCPPVSWRCR